MIAASHIVVGAATGALCRRSRLAIPLAFASHFVLDQIPHSCFNMLPPTARTGLNGVLTYGGMAAGCIVAVWALALAWRLPTRWASIAAAVAAFAPDPLTHVPPINQWFAMLPGSSLVPWVHSTFHCDVTATHPVLGFATQVVVIAIGLYILTHRKPATKQQML